MKAFSVRRYQFTDRLIWDACVSLVDPKHFMFFRDYMDYHADRFPDCSFFVEKNGFVIGVLPGTLSKENVWSTHAGLTFGGFLFKENLGTSDILYLFELLNSELKKLGVKKVLYKPIPWFYYSYPSEGPLYALFRLKASLSARQVSSVIDPEYFSLKENRKRKIKQAQEAEVEIKSSTDLEVFWNMLSDCLAARHDALPVHSLQELQLLSSRFPEHIGLRAAYRENRILAGALLYKTERVVHAQYLATTEEGRSVGALDLLIFEILGSGELSFRLLDLGTSCENQGWILNEGLVHQKEGFGARAIMYDGYEYDL